MKNEKGFTLVELLAVIVIIATILAIAIPRLLNINNSVDKEQFSININEVINIVKSDYLSNYGGSLASDEITYNVSSDGLLVGDRKLDAKLKEELNGYIVLSSDGSSKILLHNNKYCAMKNLSDKTINIVSIADAECYIN